MNTAERKNEIKGLIFDIQRFCIHDGPGIRTTVFLKGCPLRCLWCDNPESQMATPEIMYFEDKCTNCGLCVQRCPHEAIRMAGGRIKIDRSACSGCGECARACPPGALKTIGKYVSAGEVVEAVKRDDPFYRRSGGGITLSGGEPSLQPEFASEILRRCRALGIHTAMETSGYQEWGVFSRVIRFVDLVMYDLKHMDPKKHERFTGVPLEPILENARSIGRMNIPVLIRIPVVPGFTDSEENIRATVEFAKQIDSLVGIEPLAYHSIGSIKYDRLGREFKLKGLQPPDEGRMREIKSMIKDLGVPVFEKYFRLS